jgi:anti-anti-sigma factor
VKRNGSFVFMQSQSSSPGPTIIVEVGGGSGAAESEAAQFRDTLRGYLSQGYDCILVNVAQLTYIDSVMLGAIAQGYISAMRVGATMKLLHASRRVKDVLTVTKLDRVLETIDSEDERQ